MNKPMILHKPYIMYSDLSNREKYILKNIKKTKATGQLKLLLSEIEFFSLINIIELVKKHKEIIVLYLGSAPGYHIPLLIDLYNSDSITWVLYDRESHCSALDKYNNVDINQKYINDNELELFKNKYKGKKVILISDIRSMDDNSKEPTTKNILNDNQIQINVLESLIPIHSFLKHRLVFPNDNFKDYKIPCGEWYLQPFTPPYSIEMRLLVTPNSKFSFDYETIDLNKAIEVEEKMFYYNKNIRGRIIKDFSYGQRNVDYFLAFYIWNHAIVFNKIVNGNAIEYFTSKIEEYKNISN